MIYNESVVLKQNTHTEISKTLIQNLCETEQN